MHSLLTIRNVTLYSFSVILFCNDDYGVPTMENLFQHPLSLKELGWNSYFQQQITLYDTHPLTIGRIIAHHRSGYTVCTEVDEWQLPHRPNLPAMTVGDWIQFDSSLHKIKPFERQSLFRRKAAGTGREEQLIAANIDTVFIVCSLNQDFNLNRIERYLALVNEAGSVPVVVLTKQDLCSDTDEKRQQVQALDPLLLVETVNALDTGSLGNLTSWCHTGQTVALLGSSGVGKSTLVNSLTKQPVQRTHGIREQDSKGRHTTTSRSMHKMPSGGLLLDTPGMREIQLLATDEGMAETFHDIASLIEQCRFSDCQHVNEPGCAVRQALEKGEIDERRVKNYFKLQREQRRNQASLAERRQHDRELGKFYRSVLAGNRKYKNEG